MQAEQAMESKPVSSIPPKPLLQLLLPDSCFMFLSGLLSVIENELGIVKLNKLIPVQLPLVGVVA